jgi:N-methylhydantoinase A
VANRIGVDVGGTFTDFVMYDDETGQVTVAKGPTTPASPDVGIVEVVSEATDAQSLGASEYFMHGTTVGINALVERKGAVVGLLTTEGFRDLLELRRGDRPAIYDNRWKAPFPLVPRRLRRSVEERMRADGSVERELRGEDVAAAAELFKEEGVDSVAIVFINAYANPVHELAAAEALRGAGFEGEISLSHQVSGEFREYERTSTTVVDAYVRPRITGYLKSLEQGLGTNGFDGECLITRSGGGAISFAEAAGRPFETIMSGPVAGAVGAGQLCRNLGIQQGITADVGGTTFDTCLIIDGRPHVKYEGSVDDMPIQSTWVDVRSIGAGGGSIAAVDVGGLLRVGPQSAGAQPGPICYRRGGTAPTVTDAAAVLGMLAFGELAAGVHLDIEAASAALAALGEELSLGLDEVACGVMAIASAAMANAIRSVTIEQGEDPRGASILAYGGAGPLFGTLLAKELGIKQIVVPNFAGNFSAWGLLEQDLTREAAVTRIIALDDEGIGRVNAELDDLYAGLSRGESADGGPGEVREPALDLRYVGQEHTITVRPPSAVGSIDGDRAELEKAFNDEYERSFGHALTGAVEVVSVRATVRTPIEQAKYTLGDTRPVESEGKTLSAFSFTAGERREFAVVDRAALEVGATVAGPLIVVEDTTTTYVDAGFELELDPSGALFIRDTEVGE